MVVFYFFLVKQKTAYEMRISDWSSDVCSSDLRRRIAQRREDRITRRVRLPGIEIDLNGSIALDMLALLEHRRLVHDALLPVDPVRPLPRLAVRDRPDAVAQSARNRGKHFLFVTQGNAAHKENGG